ncbi:MAG: hypothetical protein QXR45_16135 [Candidatus Bathyarchaeia archaeon]
MTVVIIDPFRFTPSYGHGLAGALIKKAAKDLGSKSWKTYGALEEELGTMDVWRPCRVSNKLKKQRYTFKDTTTNFSTCSCCTRENLITGRRQHDSSIWSLRGIYAVRLFYSVY